MRESSLNGSVSAGLQYSWADLFLFCFIPDKKCRFSWYSSSENLSMYSLPKVSCRYRERCLCKKILYGLPSIEEFYSLNKLYTLLIISQYSINFFSQPSYFSSGCLNSTFSFVPTAIPMFISWLVHCFLVCVPTGQLTSPSWYPEKNIISGLKIHLI